jgi:hypothetical protein
MDRRLSFLDDLPSCRAGVLEQIAREEAPVMKKKVSFGLVFAIVLVLLSVAALAAGLLFSPRADAARTADRALEEKYGINREMQTFFGREEEELPEGIYITPEDWDLNWSYDEDYHWHESLNPDSNETSDRGTHDLEWTEVTPATKQKEGTEEGVCAVCGYKTTRPVAYVSPTGASPDIVMYAIYGVGGALALAIPIILIVSLVRNHSRKTKRRRK